MKKTDCNDFSVHEVSVSIPTGDYCPGCDFWDSQLNYCGYFLEHLGGTRLDCCYEKFGWLGDDK